MSRQESITEVVICGVSLDVSYIAFKAKKGCHDSMEVPLDPDDPEEISIESVEVNDVSDDIQNLLSSAVLNYIKDKIKKQLIATKSEGEE